MWHDFETSIFQKCYYLAHQMGHKGNLVFKVSSIILDE